MAGPITGRGVDGKGGVNEAAIDSQSRLHVRAVTEDDFQHAIDEGVGYFMTSSYNLTGGEEALSLKNDGVNLHMDSVTVSNAVTGKVSLIQQTSATAAGGTAITARNGILGGPDAPDITAFGDASVTGSLTGNTYLQQDIPATSPYTFETDGLIIPLGQVLFVRFEASGVVNVDVEFHRDPSEA